MQPDPRAAFGDRRFVADRRIAFLRLGLHRDFVAEGRSNGFLGAQMHHALFAIHHDPVAVQRIIGHAAGVDDQRDRQRPRDNRGMAANRPALQHDTAQGAAVFQQLSRSDVARHQNRVGGHLGPRVRPLPCQNAQQAIAEVIQIGQTFAQIGVGGLPHTGARQRLLFLDSRFGRQATADVFLHPAQPAFGVGEHPIGFKHLLLVLVSPRHRHHLIHADAQIIDRLVQACGFTGRVIGHKL